MVGTTGGLVGINESVDGIQLVISGFSAQTATGCITLQYTKTTDSANSGGYQAYGFSPIIYSEQEREVGVWTNGKPLYQKTVPFGQLTNNYSLSLGVSNVEYAFLVSDGCWANDSVRPIPYVIGNGSQNNIGGYFNITSSDTSFEFRLGSGSVSDTINGYITFRYTKTTDTAGSGKYNTLGVPTEHYSENEQVIGTWTNGKPLYQKTFTQQLTGTTGSIDITSLNIATGWIYDGFYDIGVTTLGLNESMGGNNVTYTHLNAGLTPPYIDCKNAISQNSTIHVTIRYTKTTN